jgi:hypothetical protein
VEVAQHRIAEPLVRTGLAELLDVDRRVGERAAATASNTGCTRCQDVSASPVIVNCTSALCRSAETSPAVYGSRRLVICPVACTPDTTARTVAWKSGASAVNVSLRTSTISPAPGVMPA